MTTAATTTISRAIARGTLRFFIVRDGKRVPVKKAPFVPALYSKE